MHGRDSKGIGVVLTSVYIVEACSIDEADNVDVIICCKRESAWQMSESVKMELVLSNMLMPSKALQ